MANHDEDDSDELDIVEFLLNVFQSLDMMVSSTIGDDEMGEEALYFEPCPIQREPSRGKASFPCSICGSDEIHRVGVDDYGYPEHQCYSCGAYIFT